MALSYSTDAQVQARTPLADEAVAAVNAARARRSLTARTLSDWRVDAQTEIDRVLLRRGITAEMVSRPDDLIPSEVALVLTLLCEAATQLPSVTAAGRVDLFAQNAVFWRETYTREIEAASPILGVKGSGRSFAWSRA